MLLAKLKLVLRIGRRTDFSLAETKLKLVLREVPWRASFSLENHAEACATGDWRTEFILLTLTLSSTGEGTDWRASFSLENHAEACATKLCRADFSLEKTKLKLVLQIALHLLYILYISYSPRILV
jgi:hypothetical protein